MVPFSLASVHSHYPFVCNPKDTAKTVQLPRAVSYLGRLSEHWGVVVPFFFSTYFPLQMCFRINAPFLFNRSTLHGSPESLREVAGPVMSRSFILTMPE